jgi:hypothetical protein
MGMLIDESGSRRNRRAGRLRSRPGVTECGQQKHGRRTHDTGERARNNVRKAIGVVLRGLHGGDVAPA